MISGRKPAEYALFSREVGIWVVIDPQPHPKEEAVVGRGLWSATSFPPLFITLQANSPHTPLKSGLRRVRTRAENPTVTLVVLEQWARTEGDMSRRKASLHRAFPLYGALTVEADP
ncbi:unnamed protein product [Gadus morhua 'NCC']